MTRFVIVPGVWTVVSCFLGVFIGRCIRLGDRDEYARVVPITVGADSAASPGEDDRAQSGGRAFAAAG
jgi:hypothetical protein